MFHTSVRRTQRLVTSREFQEWQEAYAIEPWGDDWLQAGTIAATMVNLWTKAKVKPEKFIPSVKSSRKKTAAQMETEMMHFARLHNATIAAKDQKRKGR